MGKTNFYWDPAATPPAKVTMGRLLLTQTQGNSAGYTPVEVEPGLWQISYSNDLENDYRVTVFDASDNILYQGFVTAYSTNSYSTWLVADYPSLQSQLAYQEIASLRGSINTLAQSVAQANAIAAACLDRINVQPGAGAHVYAVTITDASSTPLEGAWVRMRRDVGRNYAVMTDVNGVAAFTLDPATYRLTVSLPGYSFAPENVEVGSADEAITRSMTSQVTDGSEPDKVTGYLTVYSEAGIALSGVRVVMKPVDVQAATTGVALRSASRVETSNADGLVQFDNLLPGVTYQYGLRNSSKQVQYTIPSDATSPHALPSLVG